MLLQSKTEGLSWQNFRSPGDRIHIVNVGSVESHIPLILVILIGNSQKCFYPKNLDLSDHYSWQMSSNKIEWMRQPKIYSVTSAQLMIFLSFNKINSWRDSNIEDKEIKNYWFFFNKIWTACKTAPWTIIKNFTKSSKKLNSWCPCINCKLSKNRETILLFSLGLFRLSRKRMRSNGDQVFSWTLPR